MLGEYKRRQFVVTVYVRDSDYPTGPHGHDVQTAICHALGNGKIPADGVTVEPLGSFLGDNP